MSELRQIDQSSYIFRSVKTVRASGLFFFDLITLRSTKDCLLPMDLNHFIINLAVIE